MKKQGLLRFLTCLSVVITLSTGISALSYAGYWMADNTGYWYVHEDGTYPTYSWEWIDINGDGIYQCYAFDEKGYLYTNTITPDGYLVGPDGAWYENSVPVTRAFIHNATIAPTSIGNHNTTDYAYTVDGIQLVTKKYSNAKDKTTNSKSSSKSSSSKSSSSSSNTGAITISSNVTSSDIVNSKLVTKKTTTDSASGSSSTASDDDKSTKNTSSGSEPDISNTSYESFGPGANIPSSYSAETITPTAYIKDASPKSTKVVERDGYEDEDQSDDEDDTSEDD